MSGLSINMDASFASAEFERLMITDEALNSLCLKNSQEFFPDQSKAAPIIAQKLVTFIQDEIPLSLIRVGNGEGNALGLTGHQVHPIQLKAFNAEFHSQNGAVLREKEARAFSRTVRDALISTDIIGFRSVDRSIVSSELERIRNNIERNQVVAATGMLYAREFLRERLIQGALGSKTLTSAWIHLALIPHLREIMGVARNVVVITGRAKLKGQFESRLGSRLRSFISVPPQGYRPTFEERSHYHSVFPRILDALSADLRGTLVLVGAGLFGKVYCCAAKKSGAVAVDLGSAFDILAGVSTRPVHSRFDIQSLRWM